MPAKNEGHMQQTFVILSALVAAAAQDPASGWMAYAVGALPSHYERITTLEMTWTVSASPARSRAFFSPWFGMDPDDNLNLIQPVNPWSGSAWSMYTEYFQWAPTRNSNSRAFGVSAGAALRGSLVYDGAADSYTLTQTNLDTGDVSSQVVACQDGKKFTVPYVVYEKTFPCKDCASSSSAARARARAFPPPSFPPPRLTVSRPALSPADPPDENVTFHDIVALCDDGIDCADELVWTPSVKDANCDMTAHVLNSRAISITWDTSAASAYDHLSDVELFDLNHRGWATRLGLERPSNASAV